MIDIRWILLVTLLSLSAFFAASETAVMTLSMLRVKQLLNSGKPGAEALYRLKQYPHKFLTSVLICNDLVNVAASALGTAIAIGAFGSIGIGIATGVMTFFIILFADLIPKTYAVSNAPRIALTVARVFEALFVILSPIIFFLNLLTSTFIRLFGGTSKKVDTLTEDEIRAIVTIGAEEGAIKEKEMEMIYKVFKFDDVPVSEIMIPKRDVKMLDADTPLRELLAGRNRTKLTEHSRFPVYKGSRDTVVGVFHYKAAFRHLTKDSRKTVGDFALQPFFVPETMMIDHLFYELKDKRLQMAIVVDEHGHMKGIVTIEDLLEEIVGEIQDETEQAIRNIKPGVCLVEGTTPMGVLNEKLGTDVGNDDSESVGSYMLRRLGKTPEVGAKVVEGGLTLTVNKATGRRVRQVKVVKHRR